MKDLLLCQILFLCGIYWRVVLLWCYASHVAPKIKWHFRIYLCERLKHSKPVNRLSLVTIQRKLYFLPVNPICWASGGITVIRPTGLVLWQALKWPPSLVLTWCFSVFAEFQSQLMCRTASCVHVDTRSNTTTHRQHFELLQSDHCFPSPTLFHSDPFFSPLD